MQKFKRFGLGSLVFVSYVLALLCAACMLTCAFGGIAFTLENLFSGKLIAAGLLLLLSVACTGFCALFVLLFSEAFFRLHRYTPLVQGVMQT